VSWVIWVVIAVALAIGEVVTPGMFFLGPLALSAGAAALAGLLGAGTVGSLIVFLVAALLSLGLLRPIARRHVRMPSISRTGTDALIGRKALVTRQIDAHGGRVKIGGEEWTARSYLGDEVIAEGTTVDVIQIEGATALVTE
jgi:membrane protein implicated in regulation of membrane protease activity